MEHLPTKRVLQVLEYVADKGEKVSLAELSKRTTVPKSTLLPIMQTLCENGYLTRSDDGKYGVGTALFSLGAVAAKSFSLLDVVRKRLTVLSARFDETCYFGALENGMVLYLEKVDSTKPIRILTPVGSRLPAYATAIGKALLSDADEKLLKKLYPQGLKALTDNTITDLNALLSQLKKICSDGYATETEESTEHIACIAAPIKKYGKTVAAVSIAIPVFRFKQYERQAVVNEVIAAANDLTSLIERTNGKLAGILD